MQATQYITGFADQAVILPVIITVAIAMLCAGERRAMLIWIFGTILTLGAVMLAKMTCYACSGFFPNEWELHSPSGHTASATLVYGGLAALTFRTRYPFIATALICICFGFSIGATRLVLGVHTTSDVISGFIMGFTGAMLICLCKQNLPLEIKKKHTAIVIIPLVLVAAITHGQNLNVETEIHTRASNIWPWSLCLEHTHG